MRTDPIQLDRAFDVRLIDAVFAEKKTGIPRQTWYAILGNKQRRDADGLVTIDPATAAAIRKLMAMPVIIYVNIPDQGPRKLRADIPVNSTITPEDQIQRFHRMRKARGT
jgi:hypothetical protein